MRLSDKQINSITPGAEVIFEKHNFVVQKLINSESVQIKSIITNDIISIPITAIDSVISPPANLSVINVHDYSDEDWALANKRFKAIEPLLSMECRTRDIVSKRANECNINISTLYRWLKTFERTGHTSSLIKKSRSDYGSKKISKEVEEIIQSTIKSEYLTRQKKSMRKVCDEVFRHCFELEITPPHKCTIINRIKNLDPELVVKSREGVQKARNIYSNIKGTVPDVDSPLSVIQIDHTPVDIILVDDIHRQPIGRPYLTLAADVYSRMVLGFYISFDPPGALSTGLCISNMILPKDKWLTKHKIEDIWPCWGIPQRIHVDNAKEFRGKMLERACEEYGIKLEFRPVKRPNYGGHIERLLGTLMEEIHSLPGTTFSNTIERGEYNSSKKSIFSLSEFEEWFANLIISVYHKRYHSSIEMSPIEKYDEGIVGNDEYPGIGYQERIKDEEKLRLDFTPYVKRTIKQYGVQINNIRYFHDCLRRWINSKDPNHTSRYRKFMFRIDPRDLSIIWFFDPELRTYKAIPYRDTSKEPISIWEFKAARRRLKERKYSNIDENAIFRAVKDLREMERAASKKTKNARRNNQKRDNNRKAMSKSKGDNEKRNYILNQIDFSKVKAFEDIEKFNDEQ